MKKYNIFASIAVIIYNFKSNQSNIKNVIKMIPFGIAGSFIGVFFLGVISLEFLKKLYGVFLILYGTSMIFSVIKRKYGKKLQKISKKY